MNISSTNTSLNGVNDILTSPFLVKKVSINAHTPYDKESEQVEKIYSKDYFDTAPRVHSKLNILTQNISSNSIIQNSINSGMSPMEAVQTYKAIKAYGYNDIGFQTDIEDVSSCVYEAE